MVVKILDNFSEIHEISRKTDRAKFSNTICFQKLNKYLNFHSYIK